MRDETSNPAASHRRSPAAADPQMKPAPTGQSGQTTVPSSLLDAVIDVDAARDDGGLGLQEALHRMHEELAPLIAGRPGAADDAVAD